MFGQWGRWGCGLALAAALASPVSAQTTAGADRLEAEVVQLYRAGKYSEAIPLAKEVLALYEKALGPAHPDVATSLNNLAELYQRQGRYGEAEPLHRRSLALREKALGQEHPDVATSLNNLAALYQSQGRYGEAEPLHRRSLALREKALGAEHPDVATSLNNLALLYQAQGRYGEAEPLSRRSLALREKALGQEHPDVADSLNNLAELYREQGRYSEAEPLYKRSLALYEKALGPDHPNLGTALNNLAALFESQGRYTEAEPLHQRSLAVTEKALGPDHPGVGTRLHNLAGLYLDQGRYAEAERLYQRSLALYEKALGPNHPNLGTALTSLAGLNKSQFRYAEAELLYRRGLAIIEKALGPEHPDVATSLNNLAMLHRSQGRYAEAEPLYQRGLALREKALGPDHPDVGTSLNSLAELYRWQGRYAEAEPLYQRSLSIYEKALGPDHPWVSTALDNLAIMYFAQRQWARAADFWRRSTALTMWRARRGTPVASAPLGKGKSEAERVSYRFHGLVKVLNRIASEQRDTHEGLARETFATVQWAQGSEAAASLAQMAARGAKGDPGLATIVRERQDLVAEWQRRDGVRAAAVSQAPDNRDRAAEATNVTRLATIDIRIAEIDKRLAAEFPNYAALSRPEPLSVEEVQAQLRPDEALVLFLDTDDSLMPQMPGETFIWVVNKTNVRWVRAELGTLELTGRVALLRCGFDATAWYGKGPSRCAGMLGLSLDKAPKENEPLPFDAARAHKLYVLLFGEVRDLIAGKHLLVVPSGALTTLPFQVLVTKPPASKDLKSARWLIRDHAITVLPSVGSLSALRRTGKPSTAPKPIIGFANPLLDGNQADPADGAYFKTLAQKAQNQTACATRTALRTASFRRVTRSVAPVPTTSGLADLSQLRVQSPLPETADEVCAVARSVGADVREMRIGAKATEAEVKRLSQQGELARYRILHFATHGLLAGQLTGTREPGLILTPPNTATADDDGYLSGSEIAALKLDADWVILSACNTAGGAGEGEAAEALSGLARVFFYAGARALLVSHWEVESDAAIMLVTTAIGELAKSPDIGRGEALRRAMLAMMADTSRPASWIPAAHPSVWAPFVVVGEGGAGR